VIQPAALARLQNQAAAPTLTPPKRSIEDDETLLGEAARAALTPPSAPQAASPTAATARPGINLPWLIVIGVVIALLALFLVIRR